MISSLCFSPASDSSALVTRCSIVTCTQTIVVVVSEYPIIYPHHTGDCAAAAFRLGYQKHNKLYNHHHLLPVPLFLNGGRPGAASVVYDLGEEGD